MGILYFQFGFGLFVLLILILLAMKFSKTKNIVNDEKIIKIIRDELNRDNFDSFELKSIVAINKPNITSVIVDVGYQEIALEISNDSGKIISKEKIAR